MKLDTIQASNIKGQTFTHDLAPITIFTGANAAGKSARTDAIRLALMSYLPELGKQNSATFQLASGKEMSVMAQARALAWSKRWTLDRDMVKLAESGEAPKTPPVLIDPSLYLALSEKERVKYVFGMVNMEGSDFSGEKIVQQIESIPVEIQTPQFFLILDAISQSDFARHESGEPIQDWLAGLITDHKVLLSEANASKQRMENFAQGMVELKLADADGPPENLSSQIETAKKLVLGLTEKRGHFLAKSAEFGKWQISVAKLKDRIGAMGILTIEMQMAHAKEEMDILTSRMAPLIDTEKLFKETEALRKSLGDYELEHKLAEVKIEELTKDVQALAEEMESTVKAERCPCCNSKNKGSWKASYREKMQALRDEKQQLINVHLAAKTKAAKFAIETNSRLERQYEEINRAQSHTTAQAEIANQHIRLKRMVEIEWPNLITQAKTAQTDLEDLQKNPVQYDSDADHQNEVDLLAAKTALADLEQRQARAQAAMTERRRVEEAKASRLELEQKIAALKAVIGKLQEIQADMVEWAFGGLLKIANQITAGFLLSPLCYRDGELGRFEKGSWVSHKTFSGMEKKLVYVAISAALAQDAPIKLIVMDEMGVMAVENKRTFLNRMAWLIQQGVIDQFVGCDLASPLDIDEIASGIAIIPVN